MAAISSRSVKLKIKDSDGIFQELAGISVVSMGSRRSVVARNSVSAQGGWQELQTSSGGQQVNFEVKGIFQNSAIEEVLIDAALSGKDLSAELHLGNGKKLSGNFIISHYSQYSNVDKRTEYQATMQSSGACLYENI